MNKVIIGWSPCIDEGFIKTFKHTDKPKKLEDYDFVIEIFSSKKQACKITGLKPRAIKKVQVEVLNKLKEKL
jgi:hypothetical protein